MEARDKKVLTYSISAVLLIAVLLNFYHGATVSKIDIPGLFGIEFNSDRDKTPSGPETNQSVKALPEKPEPLQAEKSVISPEQTSPVSGVEANNAPVLEPYTTPENVKYQLQGIWYGEDGSTYEIKQSENFISFTEYSYWGISASGTGTINGNKIIIDYQTPYGTIGKANLEISGNQKVLSGHANDLTTGLSTVLKLYKE